MCKCGLLLHRPPDFRRGFRTVTRIASASLYPGHRIGEL